MEPETPSIKELKELLGMDITDGGTGASHIWHDPSWVGAKPIAISSPTYSGINTVSRTIPVDPYEKQRAITETLKRQGDEFRTRKKRVARLRCVSEAFKESQMLTIDAERAGLARAMLKASGLPEYQFDGILSEVASDYYSGGAMRRATQDYGHGAANAYPVYEYNPAHGRY